MRVAVWYWGRRGGGAQYTAALVEALTQRVDVTVSAHVSSELSTVGRVVHAVPETMTAAVHTRSGLVRSIGSGPLSVTEFIRAHRPDVVLQTMVNPVSPLAWPALRRARVPVVTVIHDAQAHPGDRHRAMEASNRFWMSASARLIAPSEHVASLIRTRSRTPVDVVPLGPHIELDDLWDPHGFVLFLGRMRAYKGLDLLAAAWSALDPVDRSAGLRIIGEASGDATVDGALAALRSLGVLVDTQWIADDALREAMFGARLIVLPYREASQSGVVTLARSARIPVLATNVGGLTEQVGQIGLLVDPTGEAIAGGLRSLLRHPDRLSALRESSIHGTDGERWTVIVERLVDSLRLVAAGR